MTAYEAYERLRTDPEYLVSVMVANNLKELNQRAQQLQLAKADLNADGMFRLFDRLAREEDYQTIQSLITGIDYVPNKLTKGNDQFFFQQFSPLYSQSPTTVQTEEEFWDQYTEAGDGDWWSDFDWGGVLSGLGDVISVFSNWGQDNEPPVQTPPNTNQNNQNNNNGGGESTYMDKVKTYGPWVAVVVLVLWLAYRKKL